MPEIPLVEPETTRIEEPDGALAALQNGDPAEVAKAYPECLAAWAALGEQALRSGDEVSAYAFFRTGYHRGLDRIRRAGWRGQGTVLWAHEGNKGFLASLAGLADVAGAIGEDGEAGRCREFLAQLAPDVP